MELLQLADEVREFLLYTVAKTGGHFGRWSRGSRTDNCFTLCI